MDTIQSTQAGSAQQRWQSHYAGEQTVRLARRCVLVVDDDEDSREALAMWLSWSGYEVIQASDGNSAVKLAHRHLPGLIFLDISMPGRNGYDVCSELRHVPVVRDSRIFALSALTGKTHDARCTEVGFTAQITKPLDLARLENLV